MELFARFFASQYGSDFKKKMKIRSESCVTTSRRILSVEDEESVYGAERAVENINIQLYSGRRRTSSSDCPRIVNEESYLLVNTEVRLGFVSSTFQALIT